MISAQAAFERLVEGNKRFVSGARADDRLPVRSRLQELETGQQPFATVLGCSDSRVPVELVFDQGLGDLFVIRVAGNIVAPSQLASIEFAAGHFATPLVVVLGHSRCGAIQAALEELERGTGGHSQNLRSVIERVRPAVEEVRETELRDDVDALIEQAVEENVRRSVTHIEQDSGIVRQLIREEKLCVVGAVYSLQSGIVEFLDQERPSL